MYIFYIVTDFLHVAKYFLKISLSYFLDNSWRYQYLLALASVKSLFPFSHSLLLLIFMALFFFLFPSLCCLGLLYSSLYSYPYNFRKYITSGYNLYNDGSRILYFLPRLLLRIWDLYIQLPPRQFHLAFSHRCLNDNLFKNWNLHFSSPYFLLFFQFPSSWRAPLSTWSSMLNNYGKY